MSLLKLEKLVTCLAQGGISSQILIPRADRNSVQLGTLLTAIIPNVF